MTKTVSIIIGDGSPQKDCDYLKVVLTERLQMQLWMCFSMRCFAVSQRLKVHLRIQTYIRAEAVQF